MPRGVLVKFDGYGEDTGFGEGVVLNFEGRGASARVEVNFDGEGSKWLVLQYAKLQAL